MNDKLTDIDYVRTFAEDSLEHFYSNCGDSCEFIVIATPEFVTKEEMFKYYKPRKISENSRLTSEDSPVIFQDYGSCYLAKIHVGRLRGTYFTKDRSEFPDERVGDYKIGYTRKPGEIIDKARICRESPLQLIMTFKILKRISSDQTQYSHTVGATIRIVNGQFRVIDQDGLLD